MRDLGALRVEQVFCLSMVDAAGFGAGVCWGLFTRAPLFPYSPSLQCLGQGHTQHPGSSGDGGREETRVCARQVPGPDCVSVCLNLF